MTEQTHGVSVFGDRFDLGAGAKLSFPMFAEAFGVERLDATTVRYTKTVNEERTAEVLLSVRPGEAAVGFDACLPGRPVVLALRKRLIVHPGLPCEATS